MVMAPNNFPMATDAGANVPTRGPTFRLGAQPRNDKKGAKLLSKNTNFEKITKHNDFAEFWLAYEVSVLSDLVTLLVTK